MQSFTLQHPCSSLARNAVPRLLLRKIGLACTPNVHLIFAQRLFRLLGKASASATRTKAQGTQEKLEAAAGRDLMPWIVRRSARWVPEAAARKPVAQIRRPAVAEPETHLFQSNMVVGQKYAPEMEA